MPTGTTSSVPVVPSPTTRHAAAVSAKKSGLNDLFKVLCAEAMQRGMNEKQALEHAVKKIEEEMNK